MCSEAIKDENVEYNGNSVNLRLSNDFEHVYKRCYLKQRIIHLFTWSIVRGQICR